MMRLSGLRRANSRAAAASGTSGSRHSICWVNASEPSSRLAAAHSDHSAMRAAASSRSASRSTIG